MTSRINFTIGPGADHKAASAEIARSRFSPRRAVSAYSVVGGAIPLPLLISVCAVSALAVWLLG